VASSLGRGRVLGAWRVVQALPSRERRNSAPRGASDSKGLASEVLVTCGCVETGVIKPGMILL
jgi:hypothetical protein